MMARLQLPPRGYYIRTRMIFQSQMTPAVFMTWLQLISLTWRGQKIPNFLVKDWVDLTRTSRTTLIRHLNWLQEQHALRWHHSEPGSVSVSFETAPSNIPSDDELPLESTSFSKLGHPIMDSSKLDNSPSLNPHSSSSQILRFEPGYQDSDLIRRDEVDGGGERVCEGERGLPILDRSLTASVQTSHPGNIPTLECTNLSIPVSDPVSAYRSLAHLTPNPAQRRILCATITDLPLWQETLEHWLMHGWNPRNITGMLELYSRGGTVGCRYCHRENPHSKAASTPLQSSLTALEAVRKKHAQAHSQD